MADILRTVFLSVGGCLLAAAPLAADQAVTVWNHAYQENYAADALDDIRAEARDAYILLDPFAEDIGADPAPLVAALKGRGNQVGAYISIGTAEDWRADFGALQPYVVKEQWGAWAGEYFISNTSQQVLTTMQARIDRIAAWGFDWVEFDNMDWAFDDDHRATYGISATDEQAIGYFNALCAHVRARGMRCMAKSTVEGTQGFDGVTYESYPDEMDWWDSDGMRAFLAAGKLVVVVHYDETDCDGVRAAYQATYGAGVSFICEDRRLQRYLRY